MNGKSDESLVFACTTPIIEGANGQARRIDVEGTPE
jgi:hypothetical protein